MKNKALLSAALVIAIASVLCSCSDTSPAQSSASEVTETSQAATVTEISSAQPETQVTATAAEPNERDKYIALSALSTGDPARFRKALEKAENGGELTVAYIGGSITEGYTVEPEQCWAYLTYRQLCEKYPDAKINYVNAGLSGTPSTLGLIRCDRDVIEPFGDPDIVYVEFAVNDDSSAVTKEAYESLVRKLLDLDSAPAVSLVFMRTDSGYSCQDWQSEVGYLYGLPMISINDALTQAIDDGYMTWGDYSNDGAHPNPEGCKFVAEAVGYMTKRLTDDSTASDKRFGADDRACDVAPIYGSGFTGTRLFDSASIEPVSMGEYGVNHSVLASFPNAWTRKGGDNEGITFDMTFGSLFIVFHCNKTKHFGTAEVFVDGELKGTVASMKNDGWSNPVPQLIMRGDEVKPHSVTVKMKDGDEKEYFGILAFGCTQ